MEFCILGPLEVRDGDRAVALGGSKPRALLAVLLINANRVVAGGRLIELLWGDEAPETATHNLQVHISQLRKVLEPAHRGGDFSVLVSRLPGYMLQVGEEDLDARRFERLLEGARQARASGHLSTAVDQLSEALALWRGAPLADVAAEPFALAEVSRLTELRLRALEDRIDARLALGQHADLIAELESLVADHPLRERLCAQLMLALYRSGRQAEASDLYYRTRQRLVDELGMEPGPQLQSLLKEIVRQESALEPPVLRPGAAAAPPVRRALCPILVGREREMQRLQEALSSPNQSGSQVVLLAGEAGIGKTRLASELNRRAVRTGTAVLWGSCSEIELSLPYLPIVEAIGNYLASVDLSQLKRRLGPLSRELGQLFPQLETEPPILSESGDPGQARLRLFEAILALLRVAAEPGGLLLVVEDCHWADASTRELLDYLVRRLRQSRATVLVTYRSDEVARGHALLPHLQAWERAGFTTIVELHPLPAEGVAGMVGAIFEQAEVTSEFRDFMHARSEGNPFILEELLKSAVDRGEIFRTEVGWGRKNLAELRIPPTVHEAILQRVSRLDKEHTEVIRTAAVLGESFGYRELTSVSELPEQTVTAALRECVMQQLIEAEADQRFRFRHALTREAVYQDLLGPERAELHVRVAEALEVMTGDRGESRYAEVARHYLLAENFKKAFQFHVLAAQSARRVYAAKEAVRHYSASLEAARALGLPEREVGDVRLQRGLVQAEVGNVADARTDFEAALQGARADGDARSEMQALSELGFLLAGAGDYRQAIPRFQDSLRTAERLDDKGAQVKALSRLSIAHTNRLRLDQAIAYGQQAETLARDLGTDAARAMPMDALLLAAVSVGDFVTADAIGPELIEIQRAQGNLWYLQFAIYQGCYVSMGRGDWQEAIHRVEEALAINRRIGDRGNEPIYHATQCWIRRTKGDFQAALSAGRRAVQLADPLGHLEWLAFASFELGATLVEVGLVEEGTSLLEQGIDAAQRAGAMNHLIRCAGYLAWAQSLAENSAASDLRKRGELLLSEIAAPPGGAYLQGVHAYTGLARAFLAARETGRAEAILMPFLSAAEASGWQHPIAEASLLIGSARVACNGVGGAEPVLRRALAVATAAQLSGLRWQAHAALAQLYSETGRNELGAAEAERARAVVVQLGDRIEDRRTRERFLSVASKSMQTRPWEVRA